MEPFTSPPRATRFLPLLISLFVVASVLAFVLVAATLMAGHAPCQLSNVQEADRPQSIDPSRFRLVTVGMPESYVLDLLGLPFESRGPQMQPIYVPAVLNPEDCTGKIPCQCEGPVKELFYYRGSLSESFYVYIDGTGVVCCHQRSHAMLMSSSSSF